MRTVLGVSFMAIAICAGQVEGGEDAVRVLMDGADAVLAITVKEIAGGQVEEMGIEEWQARAVVRETFKGKPGRGERVEFGYRVYRHSRRREPGLVEAGREYVVFLGRDGDDGWAVRDNELGVIPYDYGLAERLRFLAMPSDRETPPPPPEQVSGGARVHIALQVPHPGWTLSIEKVVRVGDACWVVARVSTQPDMIAPMVIATAADQVQIESSLPVERVFILGKQWGWDSGEPYEFLASDDALPAAVHQGEILYARGR